jgi:hypothetical protein
MKKCPSCGAEITDNFIKCDQCAARDGFALFAKPQTESSSEEKYTTVETTKKCPHCAEIIQREAIKCKHCGSKIKQGHGCLTTGIIIFLVFTLIASIGSCSKKLETPEEKAKDELHDVMLTSQVYVESNYPKTKVLIETMQAGKSAVEDGVYVASGRIDTQNMFGATIRTFYTAKVRKDSKGEWEVYECFINR